ncbi:flagellar hook protein FlgE [Lacibacterium aquatile]|uniref:Flagellar hook protein FlgE n=1 Tax=Lacibacterium aquatile TaxID=1168082 RepID=A0ABW5DNL0_9PROT
MSLNGTLITGVTGMTAQSFAMGVVSNNIANAGTVGYKDSVNRFATLVANNPAGPSGYGWGGVEARAQLRSDAQGLLISAQRSTDMAVQGRGFFAVAPRTDVTTTGLSGTAERLLTRAGDFVTDKDGFLVNSAGMTLLGVMGAAASGNGAGYDSLQPLRIDLSRTLPPTSTTTMNMGANLPANAAVGDTFDLTGPAYSAEGGSYGLRYTFTKTAANSWTVQLAGVSQNGSPVTGATVTSTPVAVTFNDEGQVTSPVPPAAVTPGTATLPGTGGVLSPAVTLNMTQLGQAFAPYNTSSNGHPELQPTGVALGEDGVLRQTFQGGYTDVIGRVPLVNVINPTGLEAVTGTTFSVTDASGAAVVTNPEENGAGLLKSEALEYSTVELAEEFSNMIVIQSSYNANSKIITTADSMYATLAGLAR